MHFHRDGVIDRAIDRAIDRTTGPAIDWAIVLAGGSGARLADIAHDASGRAVPKQYCTLSGGPSLLDDALARAARLVPPERTVVVVAEDHRPHWRHLAATSRARFVVQPQNRGTAPGILLPLLHVLVRCADARVALLPSDHFVQREAVLTGHLRRAIAAAAAEPDTVHLLGIQPDADEPGLGWIVPGPAGTVRQFVEKPPDATARALRAGGALWNSLLVAATGRALLGLYRRRLPQLLAAFAAARPLGDPARARALYDRLDDADFSRDLLQGSEPWLRLHRVAGCGWTDLGTPERIRTWARRHRRGAPLSHRGAASPGHGRTAAAADRPVLAALAMAAAAPLATRS